MEVAEIRSALPIGIWILCYPDKSRSDLVLLINGQLHTLAEALAWLQVQYEIPGPILSSERFIPAPRH